MPAATRPPSRKHHHDDRDRQGDGLAAQQVVLRRGLERSPTSTLPPTSTFGASTSSGEVLDLVGECELGLLVEVAGEGDTARAARPSVARSASLPVAPGVGDVDHAVERPRSRSRPSADAVGDRGVVDVDAVGDDGDLAAGLGEVVEALGDLAALGGATGAEVGRQHRERRAADGGAGQRGAGPRRR